MKKVYLIPLFLFLTCFALGKAPPNPNLPVGLLAYPIVEKAWAFKGDGSYHVAYEIFLSNMSHQKLTLKTLTVNGENYDRSTLKTN